MRSSLLLCLALAAAGRAQDYFPLEVGNQWIYRTAGRLGGAAATVEVTRAEWFDGRHYALVRGWNGEAWLRRGDDGALYAYQPESKAERLWTAFSGSFESGVPPCPQPARVASNAAEYKGPIGEFTNALQIDYSPGCADAGLERDLYLPWVGLVERRETTIAGPLVHELVYARLGGVTVISGRETAFGISLDRSVYQGDTATVRLTLRHTQEPPLRLTFTSGQRYDLAIVDEKGERVYVWSSDKLFPAVLGTETIAGEKHFMIAVPLDRLPSGRYVVEAWLTNTGPRAYSASAGFEVARP